MRDELPIVETETLAGDVELHSPHAVATIQACTYEHIYPRREFKDSPGRSYCSNGVSSVVDNRSTARTMLPNNTRSFPVSGPRYEAM